MAAVSQSPDQKKGRALRSNTPDNELTAPRDDPDSGRPRRTTGGKGPMPDQSSRRNLETGYGPALSGSEMMPPIPTRVKMHPRSNPFQPGGAGGPDAKFVLHEHGDIAIDEIAEGSRKWVFWINPGEEDGFYYVSHALRIV